ncbi:MAG: type II toxin-antitoxin system VapC family toxin [Chloroflexota bacterium]|nr:type II toxin-antitoxin system VapC family toxin [Chloroflexota bacterium]
MKLLVPEARSDETRSLVASARALAASRLAYIESRGVIGRIRAERRATASALDEATAALERYWSEVGVTDLDDHVAASAAGLAERHAIRGADAVHLASALRVAAVGADVVFFATWDGRLAAVAASEGLETFPDR